MSELRTSKTVLEFRALAPAFSDGLGDFFEGLAGSEAAAHFHPHPLTRESAEQLCRYEGRDLYSTAVCDSRDARAVAGRAPRPNCREIQ